MKKQLGSREKIRLLGSGKSPNERHQSDEVRQPFQKKQIEDKGLLFIYATKGA